MPGLEARMNLGSYLGAEYLLGFLTWANVMGVIGGVLYIASLAMKTVIPLRIAAIGSALFFLCSGIFARSVPAIFLYALLLPLNSYRLYQMIDLIKKVRAAASGNLSMDWLEPFMTKRKCRQGEFLFHKGDTANEMFLAVKGRYRIPELNIELRPGEIFGELGLLTSERQRTQSVQCAESGHVLTISYDEVLELYFQNPEFGFHFLRITSDRLLKDVARLEGLLAAAGKTRSS
jgi:Cyclic nucleotide-binding domain